MDHLFSNFVLMDASFRMDDGVEEGTIFWTVLFVFLTKKVLGVFDHASICASPNRKEDEYGKRKSVDDGKVTMTKDERRTKIQHEKFANK